MTDSTHAENEATRPAGSGPAPASAGDPELRKPRFICEYDYTDDIIERFAKLQVSKARSNALLAMGLIEIGIGALWIATTPGLLWPAILLALVGAYCLWYRASMARNLALRYSRAVAEDEAGMGGRRRRIIVTGEAVHILAANGRSQRYDLSALTKVEQGEDMVVAVFDIHGAALPLEKLSLGDPAELGKYLESHLARNHR